MKEIDYNPKNPDYIYKSQLIYDIAKGDRSDGKTISDLLDLGEAITINSRLSNKQTDELISALHNSKILVYFKNFIKSGWNSDHVDGIKQQVEDNGEIQTLALSLLYQFNTGNLEENKQINLLQCLLYKAHKEGFHEIHIHDDLEDIHFKRGLNFLSKKENELIKDQQKNGLSIDINIFRFEEEYDRKMVERYVKSIYSKNNVLDKLFQLEEIAYLGYTMGLRDGHRSQARYLDQNSEDF